MNKKPEQIRPSEKNQINEPLKIVEELGIFSERAKTKINFQNVNIFVWDNEPNKSSTKIEMDHFHDGAKCCKVVCGECEWSGWGISVKDIGLIAGLGADLSKFKGGKLHLYIKGNVPSLGISIGWYNIEKAGAHV